MDVLSNVIENLKLSGSAFFRANLTGNWGSQYQQASLPVFHCVLGGQCWIRLGAEGDYSLLREGDIAFFPRGAEHCISSSPDKSDLFIRQVDPEKECAANTVGNDVASVRLLCGTFRVDWLHLHPLLSTLPEFIPVQASNTGTPVEWFRHAAFAIDATLEAASPGHKHMVDKLYEVLFIQILQNYNQLGSQQNFDYLNALQNPQLRNVLTQVHQRPEYPWDTENMAGLACCSRSAFTRMFRRYVGMAPMRYLTLWRMLLARQMLSDDALSLSRIASQVGYANNSSFNKAFVRQFGMTPSLARKQVT